MRVCSAAARLAARLGLPVVATHPVQFLRPEEYRAHEARVCIAAGESDNLPMHRQRIPTRQDAVRSIEQRRQRLRCAQQVREESPRDRRTRLVALAGVWPIVTVFVVVFGGIYGGFFSPTEGAAVGTMATFVVALVVNATVLGRHRTAPLTYTRWSHLVGYPSVLFVLVFAGVGASLYLNRAREAAAPAPVTFDLRDRG